MTLPIMSVAAPPAASTAKSPAPRDPQRIYSIAELSREFAITPRTIRFYEDEGLIKPRRQGLDAHINEFKEVEAQVSAELRHRGVDPESD